MPELKVALSKAMSFAGPSGFWLLSLPPPGALLAGRA